MNNHKVHEYKSGAAGYQLPRDLSLERSLYHQGLFDKNGRFGVCFSHRQWLQKTIRQVITAGLSPA